MISGGGGGGSIGGDGDLEFNFLCKLPIHGKNNNWSNS